MLCARELLLFLESARVCPPFWESWTYFRTIQKVSSVPIGCAIFSYHSQLAVLLAVLDTPVFASIVNGCSIGCAGLLLLFVYICEVAAVWLIMWLWQGNKEIDSEWLVMEKWFQIRRCQCHVVIVMRWQHCASSTVSHPLYSILSIFGAPSHYFTITTCTDTFLIWNHFSHHQSLRSILLFPVTSHIISHTGSHFTNIHK